MRRAIEVIKLTIGQQYASACQSLVSEAIFCFCFKKVDSIIVS